jgi:hypothetical protein
MKYYPKTYYQTQVFRYNKFSAEDNPDNGQQPYHIARSKFQSYYPQDSVSRLTTPGWINPCSDIDRESLNRNQIMSISDYFWIPKICNDKNKRDKRLSEFYSDQKMKIVYI